MLAPLTAVQFWALTSTERSNRSWWAREHGQCSVCVQPIDVHAGQARNGLIESHFECAILPDGDNPTDMRASFDRMNKSLDALIKAVGKL